MSTDARTLLLGHFGSGKTEVAIHCALSLVSRGKRPLLIDLDFITPYYRSRDVAKEMEQAGVTLVAPEGDLARSDLPVVTARAAHALATYDGPVVVDVGGDEGARAIGSLAARLPAGGYQALMVVNPYRPGTTTPEQIRAYARWLEEVARIQLTGLVNNANIGPGTEPHHVTAGLGQVRQAGYLLGLPVVFTAARVEVARLLPVMKVMPLTLKMRPPWELEPVEIG